MSIKKIDKNELRGYEGKEGLILQGCGGNPQEWVDGINDLLPKRESFSTGQNSVTTTVPSLKITD